ncbi:MAG: type I methionyl aminopeptidase [Dehalococcoidia bacterium]
MAVEVKSRDELKIMREAGRIVGEVLQLLARAVRPGLVVRELDEIVRDEYGRRGVVPTFLGYPPGGPHPFPATVCVSIDDQIVHGIPGRRVLKEGEIVSIDLGVTYRGFVGDAAITVPCGAVTDEALRLIEATKGALWEGIRASQAGTRLGDVGWAIQHYAESRGYSVVRQYVGHGVGREMHEEPQVPNYGEQGKGRILREGWVIAIEPMLNLGGAETRVDPDHWTVYTADGSMSAHFEHTLAIHNGEAEVLTLP